MRADIRVSTAIQVVLTIGPEKEEHCAVRMSLDEAKQLADRLYEVIGQQKRPSETDKEAEPQSYMSHRYGDDSGVYTLDDDWLVYHFSKDKVGSEKTCATLGDPWHGFLGIKHLYGDASRLVGFRFNRHRLDQLLRKIEELRGDGKERTPEKSGPTLDEEEKLPINPMLEKKRVWLEHALLDHSRYAYRDGWLQYFIDPEVAIELETGLTLMYDYAGKCLEGIAQLRSKRRGGLAGVAFRKQALEIWLDKIAQFEAEERK